MSGRGPYLHDVPLAEALAAWKAARERAGCPKEVEAVEVNVEDALGRVTAAPVVAMRSSPAFDAAAMDGIAVRAVDTVGASETTPVTLAPDRFVVIDTGDPMPDGFDAVVMREQVHMRPDGAELLEAVVPYEHVRSVGEDVAATEFVVPQGHRLRAIDLAAIAAAGVRRLGIRRQPVVSVIPTGDELHALGDEPTPGTIPDTNSLMLAGQATEAGCRAVRWPIQPDVPEALASAIRAACAEADLVLVSAGSSAGRDDHTARVISDLGEVAVHGVAVKPGHPVILGVVDRTPVIGVPGYPVSAALTFDIFAGPLLAELEGTAAPTRRRVTARVARKLTSAMGTDDWIRVRLGRVGGELVAAPLSRGAGVLTSLVRADGILVVPAGVEGHQAGDRVEVALLRDEAAIERTIVAIGSHDLVLDLAASELRARDPRVTLASANVGSLGGLLALRDGVCHLAGSHLLDPATGEYTLPDVARILGADADVAVIRLALRTQGLIVAPGNPMDIATLADLARPGVRFVNRQRGAGTRVFLDHRLAVEGIDPASIAGYTREEFTHLAVAAAIAAGRADCGLGLLAAARAFDLDFVALGTEPYDLVMRTDTLDDPVVRPLLDLLHDPTFAAKIAALGGYASEETGRRIR